MRSLLLLLSILLISSCTASQQAITETPPVSAPVQSEPQRPHPYPIDIEQGYQYALQGDTRTESGDPGDSYWQNEASYDLTAELLPDMNRVNGNAQITYTNNSPYTIEQLILELAQNYHSEGAMRKEPAEVTGGIDLQWLTVEGDTLSVFPPDIQSIERSGYLVDATRLLIALEDPLETGESVQLETSWTFIVPEQGASGRMGRSEDNLYFIAYWYPQIMVFDDVNGWFTDAFLGNAEFYHGFADYQLAVTAPENWLIMGSGEFQNPEEVLTDRTLERYNQAGESDDVITIVRVNEFDDATRTTDSGKLTWQFRASQINDVAFSATRESQWDGGRAPIGDLDGDGSEDYTRINTFFRSSAPLWREQARYAQHSIEFLSDYLDMPYPWPHMTSVEGAGIIGGGMEFPMMTLIGSYNGNGPQQLHSVTAHEFAHMWMPMILASNERRYSWMDEGFTTFNTHQAMVDAYPASFSNENVFASYLGIAGSDAEGPMMRWSDFHYPGPAFGVASYPKPASVLTALQGLLGQESFLEAYHTYLDRWEYRHPYPWDFFNSVEDVTGEDLDWFWRSWYYETWVLDQAVGSVTSNGEITTIEILDHENVPMPVTLQITFEDGRQQTEEISVDTWLDGNRRTEVSIQSESPVSEIVIDPAMTYPDINRENNHWTASDM